MPLANVQDVVFQILVQNIPWRFRVTLYTADSKALALTQSVKHDALVLTNDLTFRGPDFTRFRGDVFRKKSGKIAFTNKTDAGAVLFIKYIETGLFGQFAYPGFLELAYREERFCQLLVTHGIQEITLVLVVVQSSEQAVLAV